MKIEKINDNQIRCTLTKEDLENRKLKLSELAYGTEKAKLLFRDMMQQAAYEFGFEANDIPLMIEAIPLSADSVILIITKVEDPEELDTRFSKFSPSNGSDSDAAPAPVPSRLEGADDILSLFNKIREARNKSAEVTQTPQETNEAQEDSTVPFNLTRLYRFSDLDTVITAAHIIKDFYHGENTLYKNKEGKEYLLVISKSEHTPEEFNRICNILSEYGANLKFTPGNEAFFEEHMTTIVVKDAIQKLALV